MTRATLTLLILLLAAGARAQEPTPAEPAAVERLAEAGAVELALVLVDAHQGPAPAPGPWVAWERLRLQLLEDQGRWRDLAARAATLPSDLPVEFLRWAGTRRAEAHLALGEGDAALGVARALIWSAHPPSRDELSHWRRLLLRAYLAADRGGDAYTTLVRYEQDYAPNDAEWKRLRARVLLAVQRPQQARASLGTDADPRARPLYLLAALHSGAMTPKAVRHEAQRAAAAKQASPAVRAQLLAAAAEAARLSRDPEGELGHLAEALAVAAPPSGPLKVDGQRLWRALGDYGRELGNRRQLLIGRDQEWFEAAADLAADHPWRAAALYSVPALGRSAQRGAAHRHLGGLLVQRAQGLVLLQALYIDGGGPAGLDDLPAELRLRLADRALEAGDFGLASRLLGDVSSPPAGEDRWAWQLRRARILVMGGDYDGADAALGGLLDGVEVLPRTRADRLMQVLFDLQRVERHRLALTLFERLPLDPEDRKLQREVLYWRADSHKALNEHVQAARLYLESAWLTGTDSMGPWAQTAQYQAADALAEAGLLADSRRVYGRLLAATKDPGRQAVIRSRLQQLALKAGKQRVEADP